MSNFSDSIQLLLPKIMNTMYISFFSLTQSSDDEKVYSLYKESEPFVNFLV